MNLKIKYFILSLLMSQHFNSNNIFAKTYNFINSFIEDEPTTKLYDNAMELLVYGISEEEKVKKIILNFYSQESFELPKLFLETPDGENFEINNNLSKTTSKNKSILEETFQIIEIDLETQVKETNGIWLLKTNENDFLNKVIKWGLKIITNKPALLIDDFHITNQNQKLVVSTPEIDEDEIEPLDKAKILLVENTKHGILELNEDGSFIYTPNQNFTGMDKFKYKVYAPLSEYNLPFEVTIIINPPETKSSFNQEDLIKKQSNLSKIINNKFQS